ncbi:unnamed protein product [Periconia digitata]|uniref:Serine/threonine-protein kinase RIO1 n=1 Tax=Periconia digitata TaxID=1303443 RepID=A0A9W4U889_9PLEO|nr:unnamed protein product [Periconia digitata]
MASPPSPASSTSSLASRRSVDVNKPQTLPDLVNHFVASKRSLNTQTILWRANDIVTSARDLLEENAILSAKNASIRNIVDTQVENLEAIRRGIDVIEADVQTEFKQLLHDLDTSFAGLQSTLAVLRDTPIESVLQPPNAPQKHLFDFIDSSTVTNLKDSLRACIDRYNEARSSLEDSKDSFDTALENLHSSIDNVPNTPLTASSPSPIPSLYRDFEGHAKEAAQAFQSLVQHYDLCVTALRHTEGGAAAATKATGDEPVPSGDQHAPPPEPISEEERQEMLSVLAKDAIEVEDVVSEIRDRGSEMSFLLSQVDSHITQLRNEDSALGSILKMISRVMTEVKSHILTARSFHGHWLEDTRPNFLSGIEEWESQRDFYERFDQAYAELLVEISSRRRRHDKAKRKAEEAQKELDRLHAEDERAREQFALTQGDFLPLDIWPGLQDPPRRYEVRPILHVAEHDGAHEGEGGEDEEDGVGTRSIPQLGRDAVERALTRVKRRIIQITPPHIAGGAQILHSTYTTFTMSTTDRLAPSDAPTNETPDEEYIEDLFDSDDEDTNDTNVTFATKVYNPQTAAQPKTQKPSANSKTSIDDQVAALAKHAGKIKISEGGGGGGGREKDKSDRATSDQVLDPRTRMILLQLINRNVVSEIHGVISTGKEANVYHAMTMTEDDARPIHRAIKIYKTAILAFKDRDKYMTGEFRFRHGYNKSNNRAMVRVWAEKELRNLKRINNAGIPCPEPLHLREHVLVMGFLGDKKGWAAPRLRDVVFNDLSAEEEEQKYKDLYIQLLSYMRIMFHTCHLVHGDLSEYNLLYHESKLFMIDVSQSVEHDHPKSLEFLRMDIKNVSDFFRSHNVEVLSERKVFGFITGAEGGNDMSDIASHIQTMFSRQEALTEDEQRAENADDDVFRTQYIPQNLEQVYDIERDADLVNSGKRGDLIYQGLLADKTASVGANESDASDAASDDEENSSDGEDESRFEKGPSRGKKHMDKDEKAAHKKAVKEEKREKRKEKMPKAVKKSLMKSSSKRK